MRLAPDEQPMRVEVFADPREVTAAALQQLEQVLRAHPDGLISFATGNTFAAFLAALAARVAAGELRLDRCLATHLDEYLGFAPDQPGGMVHELTTLCPPLRELLAVGRFWCVPSDGRAVALAQHQQRVLRQGIELQWLGIGRNGHLAFNEPGVDPTRGFHRAVLAASTRADAAARFAPQPVPAEALTAGVATVLSARRLVLVATGSAKAQAVQAMLQGPISSACPASFVRRHPDVQVLLDRAAAAELA